MAKQVLNSFQKESRASRIKNCKQCNGAPPTQESNLQGLCFSFCTLCMEVVGEYHKEGQPTKIKRKLVITETNAKEIPTKLEIEIQQLPGVNFNDLEICK